MIFCPEEGDLPRLARRAGLSVRLLRRPTFASVSFFWRNRYFANPIGFIFTARNVLRASNTLYQYLRAHPVEVLITKGLLAHFYGGLAARRLKIPCIWYMQEEVDAKRAGGLFRLFLRWSANRLPSKILLDAEALRDQFGGLAKADHLIQVIYNGIDPGQFAPCHEQQRQEARARFGIPKNALVIGQVGRLIPLKGQEVLLKAFTVLVKEFPELHLILVGAPLFGTSDYEQTLRRQAARSSLTGKVHFTGFLPDVRRGLAAMDIFVQASIETDSPVSVLEAMSCGLPLVVSGVRGTLELVTSDYDALVVRPGDASALALALTNLIKDRRLRTELGQRARTSILQKFSLQASVVKLERCLEEVYAA
jgi:glycosyltransferase involved in cell wall biosynthesis